jgi:phytanoyl-CoA hydroxylase
VLLSQEQVTQFKEDGFLVLKAFADLKECDTILGLAKSHLEDKIEPLESEKEYQRDNALSSAVRRLRQVYEREESFKTWMTNKKIKPLLQQLLRDEPILLLAHHNSIMTKQAEAVCKADVSSVKQANESTITYWHQDIRYWNYENDNLLSVWLSLGDEFLDNGLLEFIPGSHKMNFTSQQFDERLSFKEDSEQNQEILKKRVHTNLEKGDIVLFHAKVLHYAHKNSTDKAKISFVYSLRGKANLAVKNTRSDFKEINL